MAVKQIIDLTERAYASMAVDDVTALETSDGTTYKAELRDIKQYMNENKTIGGSGTAGSGDITTNSAAQTLSHKELTSPTINGGSALTVTSTELNVLDGISTSPALSVADINILAGLAAAGLTGTELGYVNGATSNIQTQLTQLAALAGASVKTYTYKTSIVTPVGGSKAITEATINTAAGVPAGYYVDHTSITATLTLESPSGTLTMCDLGGGTINFVITSQGTTTKYMDTITISGMSALATYNLAITFMAVAPAGV